MKVLWVCNKMPGTIAEALGTSTSPFGGWLDGLSASLVECGKVELNILFADSKEYSGNEGNPVFHSFISSWKCCKVKNELVLFLAIRFYSSIRTSFMYLERNIAIQPL